MANKGGKLTKKEMVKRLAARTGVRKEDVDAVVSEFVPLFQETLLSGLGFTLKGFCTFRLKHVPERELNNPVSGRVIAPAHDKIQVKLSPFLVQMVKRNKRR